MQSLWIKVSAHINAIEVMVNTFDEKVLSFAIWIIYTIILIIWIIICFTLSYCNIPGLHLSRSLSLSRSLFLSLFLLSLSFFLSLAPSLSLPLSLSSLALSLSFSLSLSSLSLFLISLSLSFFSLSLSLSRSLPLSLRANCLIAVLNCMFCSWHCCRPCLRSPSVFCSSSTSGFSPATKPLLVKPAFHIFIYCLRFSRGNNISPSFCQSGCQFLFLWMDQQVRRLTWLSGQTSSRCLERTRVSGPFQYSAGQCYAIFIVLTRCLTPINNLKKWSTKSAFLEDHVTLKMSNGCWKLSFLIK